MISKINELADSSKTIAEARKHGSEISTAKEIGLFIGYFIVLYIVMNMFGQVLFTLFRDPSQDISTLLSLLTFLPVPFFMILLSRKIEKRSLESFGFAKGAVKSVLQGLLIGFLMFVSVIAIGVILGQYEYEGVDFGCMYLFIPYLLCFAVQSFSEEFYTRGWALTYFSKNHSIIFAIILSNLVFIIPHFGNSGIDVISIVNIFVMGTLFAVLLLRFDNIWICCGVHTAWNVTQGYLLGMNVSGIETSSLVKFAQISSSPIGGGVFGPESGLITTFVGIAALLLVIYYPRKAA